MTKPYSLFVRRSAKIVCAVVWLAAFAATHIPAETFSAVHVSDVVLHLTGYLGLACVFLLTLRLHGVGLLRRIVIAAPILLLYAVLDETTQPLVNRYASLADWFANAVSVIAAVGFDTAITFLQRTWKKRGRKM